MRLPQSKLTRMALFILLLGGGVVTYSYTIGADSTIGATTQLVVDRIKERVDKLKLDELPVAQKIAKWTRADTSRQDAQDHLEMKDACLKSMFVEKNGDHFSQSRWGATPVPYQFRGLELQGPDSANVDESDKSQGIDKRVTFTFELASYRTFEDDQWSEWNFSSPPRLDKLTMVRQDGLWKVTSGANSAYSID